jgi:hypothetical protein
MHIVIPEQYQSKADGTKDYKVAAFTIPGLRFVKQTPAGRKAEDTPYPESVAKGRAKVLSQLEDLGLQTKLDVSAIAADGQQRQNRILKSSGSTFLLDLSMANSRWPVRRRKSSRDWSVSRRRGEAGPGRRIRTGGTAQCSWLPSA